MGNRSARAAEEISREMGLTIANDVHKLKQHTAKHADPTRQAIKERLQRIAYGELGKGYQDIKDFLTALRQLGVKIDPMKNKQIGFTDCGFSMPDRRLKRRRSDASSATDRCSTNSG